MATTFSITGSPRQDKGKGAARKIRAKGGIPAVLYGKGEDPILLELNTRDFLRTVTGHSVSNMILDVELGSGEPVKVLIREIQVDPVSRDVLHVDLNRVTMTEKMLIEVPLELNGVPIGVKNFGGILAHPIRTLSVLCFPTDVPEKIEVDISGMNIGDNIHAGDLEVGFEIESDPDTLIASVSLPSKAEEKAEEEEEEAAEGEEKAEGEDKAKEGEDEKKSD